MQETNAADYLRSFHDKLAISRTMDVRREEYLDCITFEANVRPLFTEIFGPLLGLKDEWAAQGASSAELDMSAFRYRRPLWGNVPVNTGWIGGDEPVILEESDELLIVRDEMGRRMQLSKKAATLPLPMDHPVADMDDWRRIKDHYALAEERFAPGWEDEARRLRRDGYVVTVNMPGGYDEPRQLMGDVGLLYAYYDQPELVHDILETIGETAYRVLDRVSAAVQVDELHVHEDMAGISGPLAGPKQVIEFIKPYYRRIWDMLRITRRARLSPGFGRRHASGDAGVHRRRRQLHVPDGADGRAWTSSRCARNTAQQVAFMGGIDKHVIRTTASRSSPNWNTRSRPWSAAAAASSVSTTASPTARRWISTASMWTRCGRFWSAKRNCCIVPIDLVHRNDAAETSTRIRPQWATEPSA